MGVQLHGALQLYMSSQKDDHTQYEPGLTGAYGGRSVITPPIHRYSRKPSDRWIGGEVPMCLSAMVATLYMLTRAAL